MMQSMWDSVTATSESVSDTVFGKVDDSTRHRMLVTIAFCLTHTVCTFGMTFFFQMLSKLNMFQKYRLTDAGQVTPKILKELWSETIVDHLVVQWLFVYLVVSRIYEASGVLDEFTAIQTPSLLKHVSQLTLAVLIEDFAFYWLHRFLHQKLISSKVHNEHHKLNANHPLAFQHAHIFEKLLVNSTVFWVPAMALGLHGSTFVLWTAFQICKSVEAHSGYNLPFSPFGILSIDREPPHVDHRSLKNRENRGSWFEAGLNTFSSLCYAFCTSLALGKSWTEI